MKKTVRCRRCLAYGHYEINCKGIDCKDIYLKCGEKGHKVKDYNNNALCINCKETGKTDFDHILGTSKCQCFKEELKRIQPK